MEYKVKIRNQEVNINTWMSDDIELIDHESWMVLADLACIQIVDAKVETPDNKRFIATVTARDQDNRQAIEISEYTISGSGDISDQFAARMAFKRAVDDCIKRLLRPYLEDAGIPRHLYTDIQVVNTKQSEPCTKMQVAYLSDILRNLDRAQIESVYDVFTVISKEDMSRIVKALLRVKSEAKNKRK